MYPNLKLLDLADNNVSDIAVDAMALNDDLETLLLPRNKLSHLESSMLFGLRGLKYLYLQVRRDGLWGFTFL